jgi:hypothetical protein
MSYSLVTPCHPCVKKHNCTDRASVAGAIAGIHQMPCGVGHLGSGTVTIVCNNLEKAQPGEEPHH